MQDTKSDHDKNRQLDKSLEDTFPASDPSSKNQTDAHPVRPIDRQPAPLDRATVDKLANEVKEKLGLPKDDGIKKGP